MLFVSTLLTDTLVFMADNGKSEDMTTVGGLVKQALDDLEYSTREVDRLTEQAGHRVAHSTISRIVNGRTEPTREQLRVLSKVLKVPLKRLHEAMGISDRFTLPDYADRLSTKEREAIRNLIQVMVEAKDEKESAHDSHTNNVAQFQATQDLSIAARNRRDGDPDLDDDNLLDDA